MKTAIVDRAVNRGRIAMYSAALESVVRFRLQFLRALSSRGWEVVVISPERDPGMIEAVVRSGGTVFTLPFNRVGANPLADASLLYRLHKHFNEIRYDHIICYGHKPVLSALLVLRLTHGPRIWCMLCGLGFVFTGDAGVQRLLRMMFRAVYPTALRRSEGLFLLNQDDLETLQAQRMLPSRLGVKILRGEGVPLEEFSVLPLPSSGPIRFLLIARLLVDKGLREFARAAAQILAIRQNVEFHIVGPLDENPAAIPREEVRQWQTAGHVVYHGPTSDVRAFIRDCSVLVLPSYREGTPRVVLEAMASGRAVITTDAAGCRDTIFAPYETVDINTRRGANGFLVKKRSSDALVTAMLQLVDSPELIAEMGRKGREFAEQHYDIDKVNEEICRFMGI